MKIAHRIRRFWRWVYTTLFPGEENVDWRLIPFQPLLYTALFTGALLMLLGGDQWAMPEVSSDQPSEPWVILSLASPPAALLSLWMIRKTAGHWRYRAFWLRLGADCGQFSAVALYLALRVIRRDFHVYPVAALFAALLFIGSLIGRDIIRLVRTEQIARNLLRERERGGNAR